MYGNYHTCINCTYGVNFYFLKISFLLGQGSFCGATDCPYFGLSLILPMGFKARVHSCLLVGSNPNCHIWCYTCLFCQADLMLDTPHASRGGQAAVGYKPRQLAPKMSMLPLSHADWQFSSVN